MPARSLARRKTATSDTAYDMAGREVKQLLETEAEWNADTFEAIKAIFSSNGVPLDVIPTTYDDEPRPRRATRKPHWTALGVFDENGLNATRFEHDDMIRALYGGLRRPAGLTVTAGGNGAREIVSSVDIDWEGYDPHSKPPKLQHQYGSRPRR
jgi:hypothetical protein